MVGAVLAINGCTGDPPDTFGEQQAPAKAAAEDGSTPISELPFVDAKDNTQLVAELLAKPTALGETTALHVKLPPPLNPELKDSLVRVVGPANDPQLLISASALEQLKLIDRSPGKDFFTAFATLPPEQLEQLQKNQDEIKSGAFGEVSEESIVFAGRSPIARTINPAIDPGSFFPGGGFGPVNRCPVRPVSTAAAWGKSLFITAPQVVQDPARTWDPCTGAGTRGGVWTFAHFIREMAQGSGKLPEVFALDWLSLWLNTYVVNGDSVPARTQMFTQVIQPWAIASGIPNPTLTTDPVTHKLIVDLHGRLLDLGIAPFRLLAIVNRIDLGETVDGPSGYSGSVTSRPKTAGELRFIFNVVQPNPWGAGTEATCGRKLFTTIFEYGVPIEGCTGVVKWAQKWTALQAFPSFSPAYLAQLQSMTESVVVHGAAPAPKGNLNAINQIRTNEIALSRPWELREFTLTDENPAAGTNTPSNGELRPHTVAQTPNDGAFPPIPGGPVVNNFVTTTVLAGTTTPPCESSYTVPYLFAGGPFRGGNTLIGAGHWNTSSVSVFSPPLNICARHQFSLNTCGGCHHDDSGTNGFAGSTNFTHVDPLSPIPVTLSKFLTGGGPGLAFNVPDPQLGAPIVWQFADLERRFQRLFDISHCTSCLIVIRTQPKFIDEIATFTPIPGDPQPDERFQFKLGPIKDINVVARILELRGKFGGEPVDHQVDFLRSIQATAE
jgi:hypothetical protein